MHHDERRDGETWITSSETAIGAARMIGSIAAVVVFIAAGLALSAWSILRRDRGDADEGGARDAGSSSDSGGSG
jgi:hypothetical protein